MQSNDDGGWKQGQWQEEEGDKWMTEEDAWAKESSIVLKFSALAKKTMTYKDRVQNAQEILVELQINPDHISQMCGATFHDDKPHMVTP